jgi:hypothetical protein
MSAPLQAERGDQSAVGGMDISRHFNPQLTPEAYRIVLGAISTETGLGIRDIRSENISVHQIQIEESARPLFAGREGLVPDHFVCYRRNDSDHQLPEARIFVDRSQLSVQFVNKQTDSVYDYVLIFPSDRPNCYSLYEKYGVAVRHYKDFEAKSAGSKAGMLLIDDGDFLDVEPIELPAQYLRSGPSATYAQPVSAAEKPADSTPAPHEHHPRFASIRELWQAASKIFYDQGTVRYRGGLDFREIRQQDGQKNFSYWNLLAYPQLRLMGDGSLLPEEVRDRGEFFLLRLSGDIPGLLQIQVLTWEEHDGKKLLGTANYINGEKGSFRWLPSTRPAENLPDFIPHYSDLAQNVDPLAVATELVENVERRIFLLPKGLSVQQRPAAVVSREMRAVRPEVAARRPQPPARPIITQPPVTEQILEEPVLVRGAVIDMQESGNPLSYEEIYDRLDSLAGKPARLRGVGTRVMVERMTRKSQIRLNFAGLDLQKVDQWNTIPPSTDTVLDLFSPNAEGGVGGQTLVVTLEAIDPSDSQSGKMKVSIGRKLASGLTLSVWKALPPEVNVDVDIVPGFFSSQAIRTLLDAIITDDIQQTVEAQASQVYPDAPIRTELMQAGFIRPGKNQ